MRVDSHTRKALNDSCDRDVDTVSRETASAKPFQARLGLRTVPPIRDRREKAIQLLASGREPTADAERSKPNSLQSYLRPSIDGRSMHPTAASVSRQEPRDIRQHHGLLTSPPRPRLLTRLSHSDTDDRAATRPTRGQASQHVSPIATHSRHRFPHGRQAVFVSGSITTKVDEPLPS